MDFQRTNVRGMRLIQQYGEFAEYGTGLGHRGDLNPFFKDFDCAFLQNK